MEDKSQQAISATDGEHQLPTVGGKFGKTDSVEGGIPLEYLTVSNIDEIKFIDDESREKFYSDHSYQNKLHYDMETLMRKHGVKSMSMTIDPFISYSRLLELCQPICDQS